MKGFLACLFVFSFGQVIFGETNTSEINGTVRMNTTDEPLMNSSNCEELFNLYNECTENLTNITGQFADLQTRFDDCGCGVDPCSVEVPADYSLGLHIAAIFIILVASARELFPLFSIFFLTRFISWSCFSTCCQVHFHAQCSSFHRCCRKVRWDWGHFVCFADSHASTSKRIAL